MMRRSLWVLLMILWCGHAFGATRLGLHVTTEERAIWLQRTTQGPYRVAGDVRTNSPGDWTRILSKANTFLSNPAVDRRVGQASASCVQPNTSMDVDNNRVIGDKLRDAAFVYLITGTLSYRTAVINELLAQAAVAGTNMADGTRWCTSVNLGDVHPTFDMATWQMKLLLGYDYILAGDTVHGQTLPAGNKTTLDAWFLAAANFWQQNLNKLIQTRYPSRNSDVYTNPTNCCLTRPGITHYGGHQTLEWHRAWSNRGLNQVRFWGAVGIMQDNATLKASAKRYVKELIKYNTFADNTLVEFERWLSDFPTLGLGYSGYVVHSIVGLADHFARAGDTELYDYSTSEGHQGTAGGTKSIQGIVQLFQSMVNGVTTRYGTDQAANNGNINYRIDTVYEPKNWFAIVDAWLPQAALFYNNATMWSYILRTCSGCPGYPSSPAHGGFEPWSGEWGVYPGILFMFAQTNANPYNLSGDTTPPNPPTDLTVDCTTSSTCNWAWTAGAGEAAATYEALFCVNAGCTPSTPVSFAGPAVSYTHTNLTASTLYRVQLRAKDAAGNASAYTTIAEDTTDLTPAPSLDLHFTMDTADISGATVNDETANNHDGTSTGSPASEAGEIAEAMVFDGVDDSVRVTRHANLEPDALTVCAWVARDGSQTGQVYYLLTKTHTNDASPTFTSYGLRVNDGGAGSDVISFVTGFSGGRHVLTSSAGALPDGVYTHVCGRYHPTGPSPQKSLWIGGNLAASAVETRALVYDTTSTGDLYLGNNGAGRLWRGSLDDVRIYDGAISDAQIAELALGTPAAVGVFAQPSWRWRLIDESETGRWQRSAGVQGRIVQGNNARVRLVVSRTVDPSAPTEFAVYARNPAGSGTWYLLDDDCDANPFCYGFDRRLENGISTTAQVAAAEDFSSGGKFYKAFGTRLDQISIGAGKSVEYEIAIRAAPDTALDATVGLCMRMSDGTELDSCSEATAIVVAPASYAP